MGNHVIRDRIWDSKKLERCSDGAAAWYPWIFLVADDWGRFEYHPHAIWKCVFRRRPSVSMQELEKWLLEYAGEGLLVRYHLDGELAFWTGFEGRKLSERRNSHYPDPMSFPDVAEIVAFIQGGGRPATMPRKRRGSIAEVARQNRARAEQGGDRAETETEAARGTSAPSSRRGKKTEEPTDTPERREVIEAFNATFGTRVGFTPGNLSAAGRALSEGYSLEHCKTVFEAVKAGSTMTAQWCRENNREFDYLVRPPYKHHRTQEITYGPLDKIPNELATGRKQAS